MALESLKNVFYNLLGYFGIENVAENQRLRFFGRTLAAQCTSIGPEGSSVDPEPLLKLNPAGLDDARPASADTASKSSVEDSSERLAPEGGSGEDTSEETASKDADQESKDTPAHVSVEDFNKLEGGSECQVSSEGSKASCTNEVEVNNALPKSPQCSDSLSRELSTAPEDDTTNIESTEPVECEAESERVEINKENTTTVETDTTPTEEVNSAACSKTNTAVGNEDVNPSNDIDDEKEYWVPAVPSTDFYGNPAPPTLINGQECILHRILPKLSSKTLKSSAKRPIHVRTRGKVTFNSPLFSEGDFSLRILHEKVCLEFIQIDSNEIHGYVRVLNTTYVKDVTVHYTKNNWKIVRTKKAEWVETVNNGAMDRFIFTIPGRQSVGQLSFSIKFNGIVDDNKGHNYTVAYEAE